MSANQKDIQKEIRQVLASFEQATGLYICVRTLSSLWREHPTGDWVVPPMYGGHRSDFCARIKDRHLEGCMRCDVRDLYHDCKPDARDLVRTCHAGANEVLIPIWHHDSLAAVIFVGQFRESDRRGPTELPILQPERLKTIRNLCVPLQSYLASLLAKLEERHRTGAAGRRGDVERFLLARLCDDPSLGELAEHLSLSPSRTSHLVRELTSQSFRQLKERYRLETARDLLARTNAKIADIADQIGFADSDYFCRYFKRKTGMTPTSYRSRHHGISGV